jgi:4-hydroxy-3-polyprenylbenzoate decarboxylase
MQYQDLREFITELEKQGQLKRIQTQVDAHLEITKICRRTLDKQGPALLFENVKNSNMPVLANLFGTTKRVATAMGQKDLTELRKLGKLLAELKQPKPPKGFKDAIEKLPILRNPFQLPWYLGLILPQH